MDATKIQKEATEKAKELLSRINSGEADLGRTLFFLDLALKGMPEPNRSNVRRGTYLLESEWCYDSTYTELVTISLEVCDSDFGYEDMLNPDVPEEQKRKLMDYLKRAYDGHVPQHGSHRMCRVYQVLRDRYFGKDAFVSGGRLTKGMVDLHLVLLPLFEFDKEGNPKPCEIDRGIPVS